MLGVVTSRGGWGQQAPRARGRGSKPPSHAHGAQRRVSQDDNLLFSILLLPSTLFFFFSLVITEPANGSQPSPRVQCGVYQQQAELLQPKKCSMVQTKKKKAFKE